MVSKYSQYRYVISSILFAIVVYDFLNPSSRFTALYSSQARGSLHLVLSTMYFSM